MSNFIPTCIICNIPFYSKVGLETHLDTVHTKQELIKILKKWGVTSN